MIWQLKPRVKRASGWRKLQGIKLKITPYCEGCGKRIRLLKRFRLQVHHKKPFHLFPELELVLSNLKTFCRKCHLEKGHLDDWKSWNPYVDELCEITLILHQNKPYTQAYSKLNDVLNRMVGEICQRPKQVVQ